MKTKKPKMAKITVKALYALNTRIKKLVASNRKYIQNIQELSALLNERAYSVDVGLVTIPEYEQRLEDYRFKVATMQATIDSLQVPELPVGIKPVSEIKLTRWQHFLKALGFNG